MYERTLVFRAVSLKSYSVPYNKITDLVLDLT